MTDAIVTTGRAVWRVGPTGPEGPSLPPVRLTCEVGIARVQDYLTPEQASELGAALCAAALRADRDQGSVMEASENLVAAVRTFNANGDRTDGTGQAERDARFDEERARA
jgi:hypothetical protein